MIRRAGVEDIPALTELLNDPLIRPTIAGEGHLDPTALITDRRNVCLFSEAGGAMFAWRGPDIFEGHSFFRVRGREAIKLGLTLLNYMEDAHGARMIWGLTPESNRAARWFNRQVGFSSQGLIETPEGVCELFVLERPCP